MFSNYKIFYLFILFVLTSNLSYSDDWYFNDRYDVGSEPVSIIVDNISSFGQCYIICYGIDKNYNDIFEEGDEYPSLWKLNIGFTTSFFSEFDMLLNTEKIRDFPFGSIGIPFRPAVDKDTLYMCQLGKVKSYLLSGQDLREITLRKNASAISKRGNHLFISVRESLDTNYVIVYDLYRNKIRDSIPAYTMVQQTLPIGNNLLAILCEGNWGSNDSKLILVKIDDGKHEILQNIVLGNGGNHLAYLNNLLVVTTGDNMLLVYNIQSNNWELVKTINLPTSGFDGVRESIFYKDSIIYTSSWDSHIYISDLHGSMPKYLNAKGKAEGFAFLDIGDYLQLLIITNQFVEGTYQPDNKIVVYSNVPIVSVEDKIINTKLKLNPNPIKEIGYLEIDNKFLTNQFRIEVYSLLGEYLGNVEKLSSVFDNRINLDFHNLSLIRGIYILRLKGEDLEENLLFIKD